ncbi:hypothetical protein [Halocatena halophila]|uniref:hypothetical protein n=1 Tax=Halocatena halophila TaxID=2814576 RepID=UPI002ED2D517
MDDRSASLLTKTQRQRIVNEFADVTSEAKGRDQRLIRQRIQAGLQDFRLLSSYPDRQFELALDDLSEEQLRRALVETQLTIERIRVLNGFDRNQLLADTHNRGTELVTPGDDLRSLERLERDTVEVGEENEPAQQTESSVGVGKWAWRARWGIVLGCCGVLVTVGLFVLSIVILGDTHSDITNLFLGVIAVFGSFSGLSVLLLVIHELLAILTVTERLLSGLRIGVLSMLESIDRFVTISGGEGDRQTRDGER